MSDGTEGRRVLSLLLISAFGHDCFTGFSPLNPAIGLTWREPYATTFSPFNGSTALTVLLYFLIYLFSYLLTVISHWTKSAGKAGLLSALSLALFQMPMTVPGTQ